jgi:hypothetical protein
MGEKSKLALVEVGYQVFVRDGGEEIGAVREVLPPPRDQLVIYVENAGDFVVPADAVTRVHHQKVVLDFTQLDPPLLEAIGHAHDAEEPGV